MGWNYLSIPKLQWCNCWSLEMDTKFLLTLYNVCNYLSMMGFKFIHVSKRGHSSTSIQPNNQNPGSPEHSLSLSYNQGAHTIVYHLEPLHAELMWENVKYICILSFPFNGVVHKVKVPLHGRPFCLIESVLCWWPGGRLNKKDGLSRYGDSHVKDKTS